jgi:hypothetical protein
MDARQYIESIKIDTKEEYNEYQSLMYDTIENGLEKDLTSVTFTWKDQKTEIDLNHISFLVGYNYAVTKTLVDLEKEDRAKNEPSATP